MPPSALVVPLPDMVPCDQLRRPVMVSVPDPVSVPLEKFNFVVLALVLLSTTALLQLMPFARDLL